ncbi:MAG: carboxypeptidase-like regulatory domain-containing protein, partial [Dyadobacter sp.]
MRQTLLVSKMGLCCCVLSFSTMMTLSAGANAGPVANGNNLHITRAALAVKDIPLKGKVVTTKNEGLPGVTVLVTDVAGAKQGATTNENGEFSFTALEAGKKYNLEFSYIGFEKQTLSDFVLSETNSTVNVTLKESAADLNEVVVVGYGSTVKKDITGSVKSLKSGEFNTGIINSPEQLFQGKVAGVNVTSATGEPGGTVSITVRGPGGVRTGSTPLFVVDGLALDNSSTGGATNPLSFLNPQDI